VPDSVAFPDESEKIHGESAMTIPRFIFDNCKSAAGVLLALLLFNTAAHAETVRWISFGIGSWFLERNWDTGAVPTADDEVIIDTGSFARVSSAGAEARQIFINQTDFLSGGIDIDSPGTLKLQAADSVLLFERGEIDVSDADALLKVQGPSAGQGLLFIGGSLDTNGTAEMTVARGARVETGQTFVSGFDNSGSDDQLDKVVVQDSGTEWQTDTALQVGLIGSARFEILDGARVHAGTVDIGIDRADVFGKSFDGTATVAISGAGSELVTTGTVGVGRNGPGVLIVDDGGRLTLQGTGTDGRVELGFDDGGTGVLFIGDGAALDAGQIIASQGSNHQIVFNHDGELWLTDTGTAGGTPVEIDGFPLSVEKQGAGTLRLSGANAWTGTTTISGGRLLVNGSIETTSPVTVKSGAVLGGSGAIASLEILVESDAALEPGNAGPGTLAVFANELLLGDTSAIRLDLNEPGPDGAGNDLLDVSGGMVLDGVIVVDPGSDFRPGEFVIAEYDSALTNRGVSVQGLPAGLSAAVSAGGGEVVLIVSGPQLALDPAGLLDFGTVAAGSASASQSVRLANVGNEVLTIQGIGAPDDPAFREIGRDCPAGAFTLDPGQSCQLEFRFEPSSPGAFDAVVPIDTAGAAGPGSMEMIGTATEGPQLTLMPAFIDFGEQPLGEPTPAEAITIMNIGAGDLTLELLELAGLHPDDYMIVFDDCSGAVLATDETCQVELDFAPLAPGVRQAELAVPSNDPAAPHAVELIGTHDVLFFDGFED